MAKMGKSQKRFNWKSRQVVNTVIDESEQKKIKVDINGSSSQFDECNTLVLPSKKRKTKKLRNKNNAPVKLLSNKQRKKLQKITERKCKKNRREELLEALNKVKATTKDMAFLTSLQTVQTLGRKKFLNSKFGDVALKQDNSEDIIANRLKWKTPKSMKRELKDKQNPAEKRVKNLHVVQSESSSSSEDESENESEFEEIASEVIEVEVEVANETDIKTSCSNETDSIKRQNATEIVNSVTNQDLNKENNTAENKELKRKFKCVYRNPENQKQRLKLPILSEEHTVMEAINENPITIIVGQTGSGKTTQVPQFLYEAGYTSNGKMIGVTEPRRVAAIQMSERVAYEMNFPSSKVSYQIRFDGNSTDETEIKFMTDGVLFKEIRKDHFLDNYSAIIIDEAHERSVHSDLLIGLLSRIVPKRNKKGDPLKLIIMSATLRIEDFTQNRSLFKDSIPPVVNIQPRMFNVSIHYNKTTDADYCSAAYTKVCKIHRKLPEGGILVFLTGQQEITELCRHLKASFPLKSSGKIDPNRLSNFKQRLKDKKEMRNYFKENKSSVDIPDVDLKSFLKPASKKTYSNDNEDDDDDNDDNSNDLSTAAGDEQPLWVLPLYSMLPRHKQKMVFESPPEGTRLCVVATNVAETSLTIPNIKYVVDSGKTKEKVYDQVTGISTYHVMWASKASASQRSGRAGRTSDGFCYRLYSSAVFNDELPQYSLPDIQRRPLDDVILSMKALKIPVAKFPFPTPPDPNHINLSIKRLLVLEALMVKGNEVNNKQKNSYLVKDTTEITELGKAMANFPVAPRFAKMILCSLNHDGILPYIILIIAALTVQEVLIEIPLGGKNLTAVQKIWEAHRAKWSSSGAAHLLGDLLVLIKAILEAESTNATYEWCQKRGIRHAALQEVRKLRRQLTNEINVLLPKVNLILDPDMQPPTHQQACTIAEVVLVGSLDQVARKVDREELETMPDKQAWKNAYRTLYSNIPAFLSLSSSLRKDYPRYVMYQDIYESTKVYLRGITVVDERWLLQSTGGLVDLSPPLDKPKPSFNSKTGQVMCHRRGTFGQDKWPLNDCEVVYPETKDLYKWVAHFLLTGKLWSALEYFVDDLFDPSIIISPISLRYREEKENLITALMSRNVNCTASLEEAWKRDPNYLKSEYFAWFENKDKLRDLSRKWPPLKEDDAWLI